MNSKLIKLLSISLMSLLLVACGSSVSDEKQAKIVQVIADNAPQFEQETRLFIESDKHISKLRNGEWKWEYKKGEKDKLLAMYGYKGDLPRWKYVVEALFGPLANVFMNTDTYFYRTLEIDLQVNSVKLIPNPD